MKRVLITGANSYIGTCFDNYIQENESGISCDKISLRGEEWKSEDFSVYDSVFHVTGKAHADVDTLTEEEKSEYYRVNCDLAYETALKAKHEGVGQFIYMSSIIVYGESAPMGQSMVINCDTPVNPANFYGDSKVKAEDKLRTLNDPSFKVVIVRPPMIYGKGSKGNYPMLSKFAGKLPFFPDIENTRSMLYIGNLCKFISLLIEDEAQGVFYPQNATYSNTSQMVKKIAEVKGRNIGLTRFFNPLIRLVGKLKIKPGRLANKAFGNMCYDMKMSEYSREYRIYDLDSSIRLTEE